MPLDLWPCYIHLPFIEISCNASISYIMQQIFSLHHLSVYWWSVQAYHIHFNTYIYVCTCMFIHPYIHACRWWLVRRSVCVVCIARFSYLSITTFFFRSLFLVLCYLFYHHSLAGPRGNCFLLMSCIHFLTYKTICIKNDKLSSRGGDRLVVRALVQKGSLWWSVFFPDRRLEIIF